MAADKEINATANAVNATAGAVARSSLARTPTSEA